MRCSHLRNAPPRTSLSIQVAYCCRTRSNSLRIVRRNRLLAMYATRREVAGNDATHPMLTSHSFSEISARWSFGTSISQTTPMRGTASANTPNTQFERIETSKALPESIGTTSAFNSTDGRDDPRITINDHLGYALNSVEELKRPPMFGVMTNPRVRSRTARIRLSSASWLSEDVKTRNSVLIGFGRSRSKKSGLFE